MAINEQIVTGRSFRKCIDVINKTWQKISFWTKACDVEFDDGKNAEEKIGAIKGITTDLNITETGYVADATSITQLYSVINDTTLREVNNINTSITGLEDYIKSVETKLNNAIAGNPDALVPYDPIKDWLTVGGTISKDDGNGRYAYCNVSFSSFKIKVTITSSAVPALAVSNTVFQYKKVSKGTYCFTGSAEKAANFGYRCYIGFCYSNPTTFNSYTVEDVTNITSFNKSFTLISDGYIMFGISGNGSANTSSYGGDGSTITLSNVTKS